MRTLLRNTTKLWYVNQTSVTDEKDSSGNYTGQVVPVYGTPTVVYLNIYPSGGEISEQIFGTDSNFDMIACSNDLIFDETTLFFLSEPSANYFSTYDYKISAIKKSINTYCYGLSKRV